MRKKVKNLVCLACGVERKNDHLKFFKLPRDLLVRKLWLEKIGRNDLVYKNVSTHFRLCEQHFSDEMFTQSRRRLTETALPGKHKTEQEKLIALENISIKPAHSTVSSTRSEAEQLQQDTSLRLEKMDKRKLIALVRKYPELYDTKNVKFQDLECKNAAWKKIASKLSFSEEDCSSTWVDLKYEYQNFVRKLRYWMIPRRSNKGKRPKMKYEKEMIFLWTFIKSRKRDNVVKKPEKVQHVMDFEFVDILDYNEPSSEDFQEEKNTIDETNKQKESEKNNADNVQTKQDKTKIGKNFKKKLLELISHYPELYDSKNHYYNEPTRKSIIWHAIANELKAQIFDCIHTWFEMKILYEYYLVTLIWWEKQKLQVPKPIYEHAESFEFYKNFVNVLKVKASKGYCMWLSRVPKNPFHSTKIDSYTLLKHVKEYPQLYCSDDENCEKITGKAYVILWQTIAKNLNTTASICERIWCTFKNTYKEINLINSGEYKIKDKWYLENLISSFYSLQQTITNTNQNEQTNPELQSLYSLSTETQNNQALVYNSGMEVFKMQDGGSTKYDFFNDKDRSTLIESVKKYYKICNTNDLWYAVALEVNKPALVCKRYWLHLRKIYDTYEARVAQGIKNPVFRYYEQMSFFKNDKYLFQKTHENFDDKSITVTTKLISNEQPKTSSSEYTDSQNMSYTIISTVPQPQISQSESSQLQISEAPSVQNSGIPKISSISVQNLDISKNSDIATEITSESLQNVVPEIMRLSPSIIIRQVHRPPQTASDSTLQQKPINPSTVSPQINSITLPATTTIASAIVNQTKRKVSLPSKTVQQSTIIIDEQPQQSQQQQQQIVFTGNKSSIPIAQIPNIDNIEKGAILKNLVSEKSPDGTIKYSIIYEVPASYVANSLQNNSGTSSKSSKARSKSSKILKSSTISKSSIPSTSSSLIDTVASTPVINQKDNVSVDKDTSSELYSQEIIKILNEFPEKLKLPFTKILHLVNAIKHFPALYDYTSQTFSEKKYIKIGWQAVSDMTGIPDEKCETIWGVLVGEFYKYINLSENNKLLIPESIQKIFDSMQFLFLIQKKVRYEFDPTISADEDKNRNVSTNINNLKNVKIINYNSKSKDNNSNPLLKSIALNQYNQLQTRVSKASSSSSSSPLPSSSSSPLPSSSSSSSLPSSSSSLPSSSSQAVLHNQSASEIKSTNDIDLLELTTRFDVITFDMLYPNIDNNQEFFSINKMKFLRIFKNYKELYCIKHPDYNDAKRRFRAWKEISFQLNNSVVNCCTFWQHLLEKYRKIKLLQKITNLKYNQWSIMFEMEECMTNTEHTCNYLNNIVNLTKKYRNFGERVSNLPEKYQHQLLFHWKALFNSVVRKMT